MRAGRLGPGRRGVVRPRRPAQGTVSVRRQGEPPVADDDAGGHGGGTNRRLDRRGAVLRHHGLRAVQLLQPVGRRERRARDVGRGAPPGRQAIRRARICPNLAGVLCGGRRVPHSLAVPRQAPVTLPPPLQAFGPTRLPHLAQTGACLCCGSRVGSRIGSRRGPATERGTRRPSCLVPPSGSSRPERPRGQPTSRSSPTTDPPDAKARLFCAHRSERTGGERDRRTPRACGRTRRLAAKAPTAPRPDRPASRGARARCTRAARRTPVTMATLPSSTGSVGWTPKSRPFKRLRHRDRSGQAEHEADADQHHALGQHQPEDAAARCCPAPCGCRSRECGGRRRSTSTP